MNGKENIDDYIGGKLQGGRLTAFEKARRQNSKLDKEVQLLQDIQAAVTDKGAMNIRQLLNEVHEENNTQNTNNQSIAYSSNRFSLKKLARIAAAILVLAFGAYLINSQFNHLKNTAKSGMNPGKLSLINLSANTDELKTQAQESYNTGNYTDAIMHLEALVKTSPKDLELQLFLGKAYYFIGNSAAAEPFLKTVSTSNTIFQVEAIWFLASMYVANDNTEQALPLLEKLKNNPIYADKTNTLLEAIKN